MEQQQLTSSETTAIAQVSPRTNPKLEPLLSNILARSNILRSPISSTFVFVK
ncbi:MAG: hypothetical protein HC773_03250 [Scytonema sp. CRU_2_7]|nr:hypothetical protein [Scytonema sp. CRU_2_7]